MINKETERKIRKLITLTEPVFKWTEDSFEFYVQKQTESYKKFIEAKILIEEIKKELLQDDSEVSSKKFTQKKLFQS